MNLNFLNNLNFTSILSTFNRSLNVLKKSIPVYREIKPYINKEKSLFKTKDKPIVQNKPHKQNNKYNDTLTFFN